MKKIELLVPVGNFDCLKAAVQNGADAVYLGASVFSARSSATNFSLSELEEAIDYAHLRNVQVHLALNTLIKNDEFEAAVSLAKSAYEFGIDAIIVQDLGLACYLIKNFPNLPVHASTQMTCHNLVGAKYLEKLGFKRIVLSRELSLSEIDYIKSNVSCEIEVFGHGALCISYSGQCLYSSLIGGRSGNRGKCAQGCRLPYELLENDTTIDKGYLLSPKDLCSLTTLPELLDTNIDSLKIEGRMKSAEYVAIVTKTYRKYIDMYYSEDNYFVEKEDIINLLQVFNRGGFSNGHLKNSPNRDLIFKEKPNNMGIYIGNVSNYNSNTGHITLTLDANLKVGDTITFENEPTTYRVSELMINKQNVESPNIGDKITIGRMKGKINISDKIFKIASKDLSSSALNSYSKEFKKTPLSCVLDVHLDEPIKLRVFDNNGIEFCFESEETPDIAVNSPVSKERLETQLNKTANTPFYFKNIKINLDNNIHIPHISQINELRRKCLDTYSKYTIDKYKRTTVITHNPFIYDDNILHSDTKICLLLNILHKEYDYSILNSVDKLYIPLKYFVNKDFSEILNMLSNRFNLYIYFPTILKSNYRNLFKNIIDNCLKTYNIKGFIISNIGYLELLSEYKNRYEFIANYTFNIFNNNSINSLEDCNVFTISPELNKNEINNISGNCNNPTEFIVYGNIPVMNSGYCLLGKSNKCYPECEQKCTSNEKYYLKDRMNFLFRVLPDNIQTVTTIYNSKINSINTHDINIDNLRIDILDENIEEINMIIKTVKSRNKLEGKDYTNGNLNRLI